MPMFMLSHFQSSLLENYAQKAAMRGCRGLDNRVYYMLAPEGQYYNYSGCGNTVNCNHPIVRKFILDALRYWVQEMHVDGFRFDLGSIMTRTHSLWHPPSLLDGSPAADASLPQGDLRSIL